MAADWIKMRADLHDDPAVIGMAMRTGTDAFSIVGRLHAIWAWADRCTSDGWVPEVSAAWIDHRVSLDGFSRAMEAVGWLEVREDGVRFPNFDLHNGQSAKRRAEDAKRKGFRKSSAEFPQNVRKSSAVDADKLRTREEKRREEKRDSGSASALPPSPGACDAIPMPDGFAVDAEPDPKFLALVTLATDRLSALTGMSAATIGGAARRLASQAAQTPVATPEGQADPEAVLAAACNVAEAQQRQAGKQHAPIGLVRARIEAEIRKASENGALPQVWSADQFGRVAADATPSANATRPIEGWRE